MPMNSLYPRYVFTCPAKELSQCKAENSAGMNVAFYSFSYLELMNSENTKWKVLKVNKIHKDCFGGFVVVR